jgi:hypothetical protein
MKTYQKLQLAGAIYETILAIPLLGAMIIMGWYWMPLVVAVVYHGITLAYTTKENGNKVGPILGMVAGVVGVIPLLGWSLHVVSAIFLYSGAFEKGQGGSRSDQSPSDQSPLDQSPSEQTLDVEVEVTEVVKTEVIPSEPIEPIGSDKSDKSIAKE